MRVADATTYFKYLSVGVGRSQPSFLVSRGIWLQTNPRANRLFKKAAIKAPFFEKMVSIGYLPGFVDVSGGGRSTGVQDGDYSGNRDRLGGRFHQFHIGHHRVILFVCRITCQRLPRHC